MIKKTHRLPLGSTKLTGKKNHTPLLTLVAAPAPTDHSRLGIIVSTTVSKKAVVRNRLKRQVAAIMQPLLHRPPYHDYLVIIKKNASNASFQALEKNLHQALPNHTP